MPPFSSISLIFVQLLIHVDTQYKITVPGFRGQDHMKYQGLFNDVYHAEIQGGFGDHLNLVINN